MSLETTPLPAAVPSSPRVLIVDDEMPIRTIARLMLESAGFAVTEASTAAEAVSEIQSAEEHFTVIILDVTLGDRNGFDVLPELRERSPVSRIILTSGYPEASLPDHAADRYLPKPFTKDQLINAIRAVGATSDTGST